MDDRGSILGTAKNFSFRHHIQIGFGISSSFYTMYLVAVYARQLGLSVKLKIHL
jgi:hypothetical protein